MSLALRSRQAAHALERGRALVREMAVEGFDPVNDEVPKHVTEVSQTPLAGVTVGTLPEAPDVDIVLSAGPVNSDGTSCDNKDQDACGLYWLNIRSGIVRATRLRQSDGTTGYVHPAISPNGNRVVYVEKNGPSNDRLLVQALGSSSFHEVVAKGGGYKGPHWPDWWDASTIVFDRHTTDHDHPSLQDPSLFTVPANGSGSAASATHVLGTAKEHYSDVDVTFKSGRRQLVSHRQGRTRPYDPLNPEEMHSQPAVQMYRAGSRVQRVSSPAFVRNAEGSGIPRALLTCQHPSWAPGGNAFTCFGHAPRMGGTNAAGREIYVRPQYEYTQDTTGRWTGSNSGPFGSDLLVQIPTQTQLITWFANSPGPNLFTRMPPQSTLNLKNARWFQENWVLLSIYTEEKPEDESEPTEAIDARTALVRRSPMRVFDLVRYVEALEGATQNSWHGYTATAVRVSSAPSLSSARPL